MSGYDELSAMVAEGRRRQTTTSTTRHLVTKTRLFSSEDPLQVGGSIHFWEGDVPFSLETCQPDGKIMQDPNRAPTKLETNSEAAWPDL